MKNADTMIMFYDTSISEVRTLSNSLSRGTKDCPPDPFTPWQLVGPGGRYKKCPTINRLMLMEVPDHNKWGAVWGDESGGNVARPYVVCVQL